MSKRKVIPKKTEKEILIKSKRRCPLCVYLSNDYNEKQGQIAHINKNPLDNTIENLVFLCFNHHDKYDGKTSQSKNYTPAEIVHYRNQLYNEIDSIILSFEKSNNLKQDSLITKTEEIFKNKQDQDFKFKFLSNLIKLNQARFTQYLFQNIFRIYQFTEYEDSPNPINIPEIKHVYDKAFKYYKNMANIGSNCEKCFKTFNPEQWNSIFDICGYSNLQNLLEDNGKFYKDKNFEIFEKKIRMLQKELKISKVQIKLDAKETYFKTIYSKFIEELGFKFRCSFIRTDEIPIDIELIDPLSKKSIKKDEYVNSYTLREYFTSHNIREIKEKERNEVFKRIGLHIINLKNQVFKNIKVKLVFPRTSILYSQDHWQVVHQISPIQPNLEKIGLKIKATYDVFAEVKKLKGLQEEHNFDYIYINKLYPPKNMSIIAFVYIEDEILFTKSFQISFKKL